MRRRPQISMEEALRVLNVDPQALNRAIGEVPDGPDIWKQRTEIYRRIIRDARRAKLREWHPDICESTDATEKAQHINFIADELMKLKIVPVHPPVTPTVSFHQHIVIIHRYGPVDQHVTYTDSRSYGGPTGGGFYRW